jgi:hypothetical protein
VTIHAALALVFLCYLAMIGRLIAEDVSRGSVSEGTQAGGVFGAIAVACVMLLVRGTVLWVRTGRQRYVVGADLAVIAPAWTLFSVLLFFDVRLWLAALGLTLLCLLVSLVVPPPPRNPVWTSGG